MNPQLSEKEKFKIYKVGGVVILGIIMLMFVINAIFIPIKAEKEISRKFDKAMIKYDDIDCSGIFDIECKVTNVISPMQNGFLYLDTMNIKNIKNLAKLGTKRANGSIKISVDGIGLKVVNKNMKNKFTENILENYFSAKKYKFEISLIYDTGILKGVKIDNIALKNKYNDIFSFQGKMSNIGSNPIIEYVNIGAIFDKSIKHSIYNAYLSSIMNMTKKEVEKYNLKSFGLKDNITEDIVWKNFINDKSFNKYKKEKNYKDIIEKIKSGDLKQILVILTNQKMIPAKDMLISIGMGEPISKFFKVEYKTDFEIKF